MGEWGDDWLLLDQSTNPEIRSALALLGDPRVKSVPHVGHNLLDYIDFIVDNYDQLPSKLVLAKGNIVPRHIEAHEFEASMKKAVFAPLYSDSLAPEIKGTQYFPVPHLMVETNNSWYANRATHRYFIEFNAMMNFLFRNWRSPNFILFNPGACFIVEGARIQNYPRAFWMALQRILNYSFFPAEAWMIERALYTIFTCNLEIHGYLRNEQSAIEALESLSDLTAVYVPGPGPLSSLKKMLHR